MGEILYFWMKNTVYSGRITCIQVPPNVTLTRPWNLPVCQGCRRKPYSGNLSVSRNPKNCSTIESMDERQPCYLHTKNQIDRPLTLPSPLGERVGVKGKVSKTFMADRQIPPRFSEALPPNLPLP